MNFDTASYTRPGGLFYDGTESTEPRRILENIVAHFDVAGRDNVIIIDHHTGLGPYGYGELQCEQPSGLKGSRASSKNPWVLRNIVGSGNVVRDQLARYAR